MPRTGFNTLVSEAQADIASQMGEALTALTERLEERHRTIVADAESKSRRQTAAHFQQAERRLRYAENREQWVQALADAAAAFAPRLALFGVEGRDLRCRAVRGVEPGRLLNALIPCDAARAIAQAAESNDTVVAIRTADEVSELVAETFQAEGIGRVYLTPLPGRKRALAVLYAEDADVAALELLMSIAAATFTETKSVPEHLLAIAPAPKPAPLPPEERELHVRAQRFARVKASELRLRSSSKVVEGRLKQNLYDLLHDEIEAGRESYRGSFLGKSTTMVDYFHQELVRTLANDDPALLGSTYPGPLA